MLNKLTSLDEFIISSLWYTYITNRTYCIGLWERLNELITYIHDIYLYGRKWRRTKEPLDESERGELA